MSSRRIQIFDTTLRHGEQSPWVELQPHEKVEVAQQLERLGVDVIEAGHPGASPAELEGVSAVAAAVEGEEEAMRCAGQLARALGMTPFRLSASSKPRYHAGAAIAGNMTHVLVGTGRALLIRAGVPRRLAAAALRPLVSGSVEAALSARALERLTGPVARGDARAVRADLQALPPRVRSVYRAVAALAIAEMKGDGLLSERQVRQLVTALTAKT